ncbi:MAG: DUF1786 family protein [Chloroflexi bacterium]|nr:DUF1786 family protein [Chloroflexota bacterium]
MKILAVDIGTGTQDILLYESGSDIENGYKMILPSPTVIIQQKVNAATRDKKDILLYGVTMGGGPNSWAVKDHLAKGFKVFATPEAAKTFDDDLNVIRDMGITVISEDEASILSNEVLRIELYDFSFSRIEKAFSAFHVTLSDLSVIAVAVFDHGYAPAGMSDRTFRFNYLDEMIRTHNDLTAFAYRSDQIPKIMTRMQSVAKSARSVPFPLVVMDTAPAAVLGATFDTSFTTRERTLLANIGNGHTLAFRLGPSGIEGVFEHHTGAIDCDDFDLLIDDFAQGTLSNEKVHQDHGHGALIYQKDPLPMDHADFNLFLTGPRRYKFKTSRHRPHFAVPFGDMMLSGCFGLLAATADLFPNFAESIHDSLKVDHTNNSKY